MSSAYDVNTMSGGFASGTVAVGTTYAWIGKAPSDALGGCITVLGGAVVTSATNGAGSAPQFRVLKYNSGGTVTGTIAAAVPAAAALTANVPSAFTITAGYVDAGEYIVVERGGTAASATAAKQDVFINYVMGR